MGRQGRQGGMSGGPWAGGDKGRQGEASLSQHCSAREEQAAPALLLLLLSSAWRRGHCLPAYLPPAFPHCLGQRRNLLPLPCPELCCTWGLGTDAGGSFERGTGTGGLGNLLISVFSNFL